MVRLLFLTHRYLGIAMGLVVSLWCLSGFVMMYVQYPKMSDEEQLAGLETLDFTDCCHMPPVFSNLELAGFRVEMLDARPVLRLLSGGKQYVLDLQGGTQLGGFSESDARSLAVVASSELELGGRAELLDVIERDQWTVSGYDSHRPLFRFSAQDPRGTEFYISSTTGEVVQLTTARERLWNWLGSVVHWIYPTMLRQHTFAWVQTIIWLSIVSLFLTITGMYIGIRQYRTRRNGRKSPYHGWSLWHHYSGLIFGLLTFTWLLSGLFSVNPWGAFLGRGDDAENQHLRGLVLDYATTRELVEALEPSGIHDSSVRLEASVVNGEISLLSWDEHGARRRLGADQSDIGPMPATFFAGAGKLMRPDAAIKDEGWMVEEDAYYYDHHLTRRFPVYRIQYDDGERFYLDDVTGELVFSVDRDRQWSRWVYLALHRGDLSRLLRSRPLWDLLMLPLLLGVTIGAISGTWLGFRRIVYVAKSRSRIRRSGYSQRTSYRAN